jgi:origin recognition complex subunit 4
MVGNLSEMFGFRRSGGEKENIGAVGEKDELANEEGESEEEEDIWEVPDEEESEKKTGFERAKGTPSTKGKRTPVSQRKTGRAKPVIHNGGLESSKNDIYEVEDSEEDVNVSTSARSKRNVDRTPSIPKFTKKSKKVPEEQEGNATLKRPRGRPPKQTETVASSPRPSAGKPRARDILKKAKKLSREAIFQQMVEEGRKNAEESEEAQTSARRRSGRGNAEAENEVDEDKAEGAEATIPVRRGRPKNATIDPIKEVPKGILTPTKDRTLKSRKSVAFEARNDNDLGFKDLPDFANKTSTSRKGRKPSFLSHDDREETTSKVSWKGSKQADSAKESSGPEEEESEDIDDESCEVCKGLDSNRGNFIIFCENCNFAVHQKCYDIPKVPKGDWFCRDCQPDNNEDTLALGMDDDVIVGEVFNDLPEIDGFEDHLQYMQRVLLDRLTGQKPVNLRGHDEEMRKVHQVIEQTVLAGEGNSMLVIGARGCGKTTVSASIHRSRTVTKVLYSSLNQSSRVSLWIIARSSTWSVSTDSFIRMTGWL